jgi:membrane-associated phospholipid phosphatase
MGAMLGAFIGLQIVLMLDLLWLISIGVFLAGLVGFARLRAGTHSQAQIYLGYALGFIVMFLLIRYY